MQDRAEIIDRNFLDRVARGALPPVKTALSGSPLTPAALAGIFESQVLSRHLDFAARRLQARGEGFYTIGSSGHEGTAAIAAAFRLTDMAFLHYRDAAFMIERARLRPGATPLRDMMLSFVASAEDPISGGRHKVLGSAALFVPPQTSTIASHLPKAVGAAYAVGLRKRLGCPGILPDDAVILCSFGDASLNHSTAQGALNAASWTSFQNIPLPLLFVCEDNGIGISVPTPPGWVAASMGQRPGIRYIACNGLDAVDTARAAGEAQAYIRKTRKPAFLHMSCVRLFGHAGADAQHMYLSAAQIEEAESLDPLLHTAALLIANGVMDAPRILDLYEKTRSRVARAAEEAVKRPKLETAAQVMAPIVPPKKQPPPPYPLPVPPRGNEKPQPMARLLNAALSDLMRDIPALVLAGEDVGRKGGVYTVTKDLQALYGAHRVIDTLLDEQGILGLAIGLAHNGILPVPEIQFLAYFHNACDQIRGEAATLSFFSNGQYTNPMVVRIAGLGYQKGFGGHFHNDNSIAALRDIPGLVIACPSNGADAAGMIRECVRLAREEQRVVIFLEPIALYMTRDLHSEGDGLLCFEYAKVPPSVGFGDIAQHGSGTDLCILTYGNGCYLSRQAAKLLEAEHKIAARVIDLRWLAPLNEAAIVSAAAPCRAVLVVDECRRTGSLGEGLVTLLHERLPAGCALKLLAAEDSFIPLGRAATVTLPSRDAIVEAAASLLKPKPRRKRKAA